MNQPRGLRFNIKNILVFTALVALSLFVFTRDKETMRRIFLGSSVMSSAVLIYICTARYLKK